jgi:hypothetical protein
MAGLHHQHLVARRQRIDDRRLPGAGAGGRKNDDRAGSLEDFLAAFENRFAELGKRLAAVVDDRHVHGAEHPIRHRARAGNLQKMASLMRHGFLTRLLARNIAFIFAGFNRQIVYTFLIDGTPSTA